MAHHSATRKSIRSNKTRTERNGVVKSRFRTFIKKAEEAISNGDKGALTALRTAESELFKAVKRGIVKKNAAARKISRLSARLKAAK